MKRFLKILLYFILSVVLLIGIGAYIMRNYLQEIILNRLQTEIETTFGNYYHLEYAVIQTRIDAGTFGVKIIKPIFTTDTTQYDFVAKYPVIFFKADSFEVNGINIQRLFTSQFIELNTIELSNPALQLLIHRRQKKQQTETPTVKTPHTLIHEILLQKLSIKKGNVSVLHLRDITDTLYYGEKINLEVSKASIPMQATEGIYAASAIGNILFSMSNVQFYPDGSPYSFSMKELKFDAKQNTLDCRKVDVFPDKSLLRMSKNSTFQKTFAELQIGNLSLRGIDYDKLGDAALTVKHVEIANSHFLLLRNRNKLLDKSLSKKSIQEALLDVKVPLTIDTLKLNNIHLSMAIHFPNHNDPATIQLRHINGTLLHIDNNPKTKHPMVLHANATIMQTGKLVFDASFPIDKQTHTYSAHITNMPFNEWNQVISRLANVQLTSGNIKNVQLNGNATSLETNGTIVFEYNDLQATVYKKDKHGELKKAPTLTFIANGLLRLHNPPKGESKPITESYYYKREPYQGQIMLWIGGLLDGIEATLLNERLKKKVDEAEAENVKTRKK